MEISSISGPDVVPGGFSTEPPIREEAAEKQNTTGERVQLEEQKGNNIDTYA